MTDTPVTNNTSIPTDFLSSLGNALGGKLADFLIKLIDRHFPPDGGCTND